MSSNASPTSPVSVSTNIHASPHTDRSGNPERGMEANSRLISSKIKESIYVVCDKDAGSPNISTKSIPSQNDNESTSQCSFSKNGFSVSLGSRQNSSLLNGSVGKREPQQHMGSSSSNSQNLHNMGGPCQEYSSSFGTGTLETSKDHSSIIQGAPFRNSGYNLTPPPRMCKGSPALVPTCFVKLANDVWLSPTTKLCSASAPASYRNSSARTNSASPKMSSCDRNAASLLGRFVSLREQVGAEGQKVASSTTVRKVDKCMALNFDDHTRPKIISWDASDDYRNKSSNMNMNSSAVSTPETTTSTTEESTSKQQSQNRVGTQNNSPSPDSGLSSPLLPLDKSVFEMLNSLVTTNAEGTGDLSSLLPTDVSFPSLKDNSVVELSQSITRGIVPIAPVLESELGSRCTIVSLGPEIPVKNVLATNNHPTLLVNQQNRTSGKLSNPPVRSTKQKRCGCCTIL